MTVQSPLGLHQEIAVRDSAFALLERSGFRVMDLECLRLLEASGCKVEHDRCLVRLTETQIADVIAKARASNSGASGSPAPAGTPVGGVQPLVRGIADKPRPATTEDLVLSLRIADQMEGVRSIAPPLTNSEARPETEPIETLATVMKTCRRPLDWFDVSQPGLTEYLIRLGEIYTGVPRSTHFLSGVYCVTTPLTLGERVCRCMLERVPLSVMTIPTSMPISGANVPISPLAAMAMAVAEILAGWATALALNPDAPLAGLVCTGSMDVATGRARFSSIEAIWQDAGVARVLGRGLGAAVWCAHSYTDGSEPGYPAVADKLFKSLTLQRFGAGVGYHQGTLEAGRVYCNEQLAIDVELNGLLHRSDAGPIVEDLDTMLEPLLEAGSDTHRDWLTDPTTLQNMRKAQAPLDLLRPESAQEILRRADEKCKQALARYTPPELPADKLRAIDNVVDAARMQLLGER